MGWYSNLRSSLLRCGTRPNEWGHPMRLELIRVGLLTVTPPKVPLMGWYSNLRSSLLRCGTRPNKWGHPMRLELIRVGLLAKFANRYTTKGALNGVV